MVTISAQDRRFDGLTILDRAQRKVDRQAVERAEKERIARETAERIEYLHSRLFGKVSLTSGVAALRTEDAALRAFGHALDQADNRLQIEILRVAIDNRWASVVNAFIKVWVGEHPIGDTAKELWTLTTTSRASV